ncbi:HAMP domain-containing histidine kinase [Sphingomonas panacisoli]|uniref:histidine kinase n=1 Tax=Sphingomonas panacisoli TaxID=1813879 RepID=A0A5B8LI45_9SPHN|nr:HAMP domain-containing sensor histidine kinase [Sphingomonas panacisoli]QDZ07918.1 HAMP domain-containing histidine kinase [Sphingomonas panacisoli]
MASLRASAAYRIAFTYALTFTIAILLLGVAVYFVADAEFRGERDQAISGEIVDLTREGDGSELIEDIGAREAARAKPTFGYAVFDKAGLRIGGRLDTPRPELGFSMITFRDPIEGADAARARAVDLPDGRRLVVAVDSEAIEQIDATILTLFGAAFVVVLLIGGAGGLLLGRYLRRRLGTISATANAIVAGDIGQRMPVGASGDEFDAVALALNAMLDRIASLMENLRQVSSDVAHDLRTPLLRLRGQLERVGKEEGAAQRALDQGDELLRLFSAILRITEVESGGLERSFIRIDLSTLTHDVAESFLPALHDGGRTLDWEIEPDIFVHGDRELIAQSLANMLDNSQTHTPPGTHIVMTLDANTEWVRLSVSDDGPGVPREERDAILRRFYRTEASRTTPGNGLGLSLVSAVAAAHGGEIAVAASQPRGLRLTMVLPRTP